MPEKKIKKVKLESVATYLVDFTKKTKEPR
jgi:hypothetical protein